MSISANPHPQTTALAARLLSEGLKSLAQVARKVPSFRNERPTSPGCVWRWATRGARAADGSVVKLEAVNLCGRLLTSEQALARFLALLTGPPVDSTAPESMSPTPAARRRAAEAAGDRLDRTGR